MTSAAPRACFPKQARLLAPAHFKAVFDAGQRCAAPELVLHRRPCAHPPRLGLAVSRKVSADAVGRNRIRRVWRETFRQHRHRIVPGDYVVVARGPAAQLDNAGLRRALLAVLQRCRALLPADAATMPDLPV